ncbi:MAG TPA: WG repeat-containing protein, partial [Puia sp.]|nr:WG repeat-containing protein [Puia sp.]
NGILEAPGKPVLPIIYDLIEPSNAGVLLLKTNGQFGLMAPDLHWIVPLGQYDSLAPAAENLLFSFKGGHEGLISSDGTEVLAAVNDKLSFEMTSLNEKAGNSGGNYTIVKTGKSYGLLSRDGGMILPATYELLTQELGIPSRCLIVVQNGKYGLWQAAQDVVSSLPSNLLIPIKYEELNGINDQLMIAKEKGKYGVIRISNQEVVLPFVYSSVEYASGGLVAYDGSYHLYTLDKDKLIPRPVVH